MSENFCTEKASRDLKNLKKALSKRGVDVKLRELQDAVAETCGHRVWGSIRKLSEQPKHSKQSALQIIEDTLGQANPGGKDPIRFSRTRDGKYRFFSIFDVDLDEKKMTPMGLVENLPSYLDSLVDRGLPVEDASYRVDHHNIYFHLPDVLADLEEGLLEIVTSGLGKSGPTVDTQIVGDLKRANALNRRELAATNNPELADLIDMVDGHILAHEHPDRKVWYCSGEEGDGGCRRPILEDENGLCICDFCGAEFTPSVKFEFDLSFYGGDYGDVGDFAYVPIRLIDKHGYEKAFEIHTGHNRQHIIHYESEETFNQDGDEINTDFIDISTSKKLLK